MGLLKMIFVIIDCKLLKYVCMILYAISMVYFSVVYVMHY